MDATMNGVEQATDRVRLDEAAVSMIAEIRQAAALQMQSILQYFARQNGLKGPMRLSDDGREVILGQ
jgi:hypothetical protein